MTVAAYLRTANTPWKMRYFMFNRLPAAWFMGIGVQELSSERAVIRLPYGWRSQNPFKSIYFAAQCAAAEMSTGLLATAALQEQPPVSMLVRHIEAEFLKKASHTLLFTCEQGAEVQAVIRKAVETGEPQTLRMAAVGRLPDGVEASKVWVEWSFKVKS
jgi:Domain of unknown function (DUF4442)